MTKVVVYKDLMQSLLMHYLLKCLYFCRDEFNVDTLKAFVRLHDFAGHTLVDALR
jgi:hypothetical protein